MANPDQAIERALVLELRRCWAERNARDFGGELPPAVVALHDGGPLGRYDPSIHEISFRRDFVLSAPWGQVVEVLRHECAHQYVHEVLHVQETAHGPTFRRVCAERSIDARAAGLPTGDDHDIDRLIRKVRALLALSSSDNPHEARAAARRARALLVEHDLSLEDEGRAHTFQQVGPSRRRFAKWEKLLAAVLERHFGVQAIYALAYLPQDRAWGRVLELMGTTEHVEVAAYMHDALRNHADGAWRRYRDERGLARDSERQNYLCGLMLGFLERLDQDHEVASSGPTALVAVDERELRTYVRKRHPHIRTTRTQAARRTGALEAGRVDGQQLRVPRGVRHEEEPRKLTVR
jgi:hypothetical protein